ncbi:MAG: hypothetical protein AB4426_16905 [Xenococcaceae cyanobacterium]
MSSFEGYESYIEIAVDVFQAQNQKLIDSLKDFLTFLPNPNYIEQVLAGAIYRLAEINPDACRWLLRNPSYLMPELDLVDLAKKMTLSKLQSHGFVEEQDFWFEANNKLQLSETAKAKLLEGNSAGDRLLLEEILQVGD